MKIFFWPLLIISLDCLADNNFLKLARVLSYQGKHEESLIYYDKYLNAKAHDENALVEKARVLGWMGEHSQSIETYQKAFTIGKNKKVELELIAKRNYWHGLYWQAVKYYEELLLLEPGNVDARNDLSQIKASLQLYSEAQKDFDGILKVDKNSTLAQDGKNRSELLLDNGQYDVFLSNRRVKSPDRVTDINNQNGGVRFNTPLKYDFVLIGAYIHDDYRFDNFPDLYRDQLEAGVRYKILPKLKLELLLRQSINYSYERQNITYYNIDLDYKINDSWKAQIISNSNDLDNSYNTLSGGYHFNEHQLKIGRVMNQIWQQEVFYKLKLINDGNDGQVVGLKEDLFFYYGKYQLLSSLSFMYEKWKYDHGNLYFSPLNFWSLPLLFHFRYYLNENGRHFGARDIFWGVKYTIQYDKNSDLFNRLGLELNYDLSDRYSIFGEASLGNSKNYDELIMAVSLKGYI